MNSHFEISIQKIHQTFLKFFAITAPLLIVAAAARLYEVFLLQSAYGLGNCLKINIIGCLYIRDYDDGIISN